MDTCVNAYTCSTCLCFLLHNGEKVLSLLPNMLVTTVVAVTAVVKLYDPVLSGIRGRPTACKADQ
jgi:hypothetical protein